MNQWEQAIVERTEAALRQTEPYREKEEWEVPPDENFQLSYILTKGDPAEPETILAIAICEDEAFLFYPLKPGGGDIAGGRGRTAPAGSGGGRRREPGPERYAGF